MTHRRKTVDLTMGFGVGICLGLFALAVVAGFFLPWTNAGPFERAGVLAATALEWSRTNLKASVYGFAGALVLYAWALVRLSRLLNADDPAPEKVIHAEQMADIGINLFFGIGVVWTAIGMRGALIQGLSGLTQQTAAQQGAFFILKRLVDGGILLALSTTVFGGIGGYVLRILKAIWVGKKMLAWQICLEQQKTQRLMDQLASIEKQLINQTDSDEKPAVPKTQKAESRPMEPAITISGVHGPCPENGAKSSPLKTEAAP